MKRGLILLLLAASCFLFFGCTKKIFVPVVHNRTVTDTVVASLADSAMIRALFECDSSGQVLIKELSQVKGKMASQSLDFSNNELRVETRWQTKYIERLVEVRDTVTVVDVRKEMVPTPYIPKFFWGCFVITFISFGWVIMRVMKKV